MNFKQWLEVNFDIPFKIYGKLAKNTKEADDIRADFLKKQGYSDEDIKNFRQEVDLNNFGGKMNSIKLLKDPNYKNFFFKLLHLVPETNERKLILKAIHNDPMAHFELLRILNKELNDKKIIEYITKLKNSKITDFEEDPEKNKLTNQN